MESRPIRILHIIGILVGGGVETVVMNYYKLSLIHISEPTRQAEISYAVFCLKKKKKQKAKMEQDELHQCKVNPVITRIYR